MLEEKSQWLHGSLYAWHDDLSAQLLNEVHVRVDVAHNHTEQTCWC